MPEPAAPETTDISVLFVDLRNFTFLLDRYDTDRVYGILDTLFTEIRSAVDSNGGTVDKLIGDGMMAIFGGGGCEQRAVDCAVEIVDECVAAAERESGFDVIRVGIGIATGAAREVEIAGVDETVVGRCVNIAARLQGLCKEFSVPILIDEATRDGATALPDRYVFRQIPDQSLRGIVDDVNTYQPWNTAPVDDEYVHLFLDGIEKFNARDHHGALQSFIRGYSSPTRVRDQALLDHFTSRCFENLSDTSDTFQNAERYEQHSTTQEKQSVDLLYEVERVRGRDFEPATILDIGCGTGKVTEQIARRYPEASVRAIDSSISQVYKAREQHGPPELDITYRCKDIETYCAEDAFELVISNSAMHWVQQQEEAYRNVRKMIDDGGLLAVHQGHHGCYEELRTEAWNAVESCGFGEYFRGFEYPLVYHTETEIRDLLDRTGFGSVRVDVLARQLPDTIIDDFAEAGLLPFIERLEHDHQEKVFVDRFKKLAGERLEPKDITAERLYVTAEPI